MDTEAIYRAVCDYGQAKYHCWESDSADHLSEIKRLLREAEDERAELLKENERLCDEVESLRKDAERFRFADQSPSDFAICYWHKEPGEGGDWWCHGPRGDSITLLDKAIAESKRSA